MRKFIYKLYVRLNTSIFAYKMSSGLNKLAYILGIKFIAWLVVFSLAAGISPGVVAGDAKDCADYLTAEDYKRAFPLCSRAAKQGDVLAQSVLGLLYFDGRGVPKNYREAIKWFRLAAWQGDATAQYSLGFMYANGKGVPKNDREAVKWYRLAAEQGHVKAQVNLGWIYDNGEGMPKDDREAVKWYRLAAEQGIAIVQSLLGWKYFSGEGVPQNDREAVKWYRLAAKQGLADAQFNLGWMYDNGRGMPENDREAVKWYRLAAEQGDAKAQFNLGNMYFTGRGVPQNDREAVKWVRLAAEQGHADAQFRLGWMYSNGEGVPKNDREAVKWYKLAAEQGHTTAQSSLGVMYYNGEGVPKNDREAVKWYRLAAEQGYANGQYNLGVMYHRGEGVIQDYQEAYIWYSLAAVSGHKDASKWRDEAAQLLTVSELRIARQEAKKRIQQIESRQSEQPANDSPPITDIAPRVAVAPDIPPNAAAVAFENGWRSVVVIKTDTGQGSGVIIRPNLVATNCHVVDDGTAIMVFKANNRRAQKDEEFRAQIHRAHEARDLCLLEVAGLWGIPANLRRTDSLTVGESVYAIGAPQGLDYSLSAGVISQLRKEEGESIPRIQTDAAISPGSSGGGLFDAQGNLVGITTSIQKGDQVEGINFAIPADWILQAEQ